MLSRNDIQYPEHARASEPVKGRKIKTDKKAYSHVSPYISASLAGAMMFSYLSSYKLTASADNPSSKPVAAAVTELSFEPFPEIFSEQVARERKKLHSLPSPEPSPTPVRNLIRIPTPTPEPTPEPIEEYISVLEPEPTPTPSDPEPTPEPLKAPEFLSKPVIRVAGYEEGWINNCSVTVGLNDAKDNNATARLILNDSEDPVEGQTCAEYVPGSSGTDGNWASTVTYQGDFEVRQSVRLQVDYTMSNGSAATLVSDPFDIYSGDFVDPETPRYADGYLFFTYNLSQDSSCIADPDLSLHYYDASGQEGPQVDPEIYRNTLDYENSIDVSYNVGLGVASYEARAEFTYEGEGSTWVSVQEQSGAFN